MTQDYTPHLQHLMQQVGLSSFRALSQATGISTKQIRQLRQGSLAQLRVAALIKLSGVLQISVEKLLTSFSEPEPQSIEPQNPLQGSQESVPKQEYLRLQTQLIQQKQQLWQEFQQTSLQILEPLLLQLPTARYAAEQNPQVPAVKLLPLLQPLEQLWQEWGLESIAAVGSEMPYDPQQQQLMDGIAKIGDPVRVRYTGYRQGERMLYRAKVSPVLKH